MDGDGIKDHAVLRTLDDGYLSCLLLDGHILVDDADTTFAGNGDGHRTFGHRVHGRRHNRHIEGDVARELRFQLHLFGQHF